MRKIKSMADIERIRRRNNIILGVIMVFLLIGSSLGYSLMSADVEKKNSVSENGFDFFKEDGLWKILFDTQTFAFQNLPSELSDIEINVSAQLGQYSGQPLYIVNPGEGAGEILSNIGGYALRYQEACLNGSEIGDEVANESFECSGNLPVKNCNSNMIVFENGENNLVYSRDNCVFIVGDGVRGSDIFLYKILGIL